VRYGLPTRRRHHLPDILTLAWCDALIPKCMRSSKQCALPNMRLKLPGARVRRIAFPRLRALPAAQFPCARRHCARSLSAIR